MYISTQQGPATPGLTSIPHRVGTFDDHPRGTSASAINCDLLGTDMTTNLDRVDYSDRYGVDVPEPMDAPRFCELILEAAPRWLGILLSARDLVAGRLGFHTQENNYGSRVDVVPGNKFGPLVVESVSPVQVVCGDVDEHLAFRAIFAVDPIRSRGSFTTEVQFLDSVGRSYFALVKPFHKRLIPVLVSRPFSSAARAESVAAPT